LAKAGVLRTFNFSKPGTSDDFVAASKNGICLVTGWGFSQPDLLQHYREYFQGVFRLEIADSWKEYFENREVLGLHVRRGDYADFENGRYCYSDSQYICILERAIEIIGLRDPRIILFTNDQCLDFSAYRERFIDCVLSKESYEMDHALMSRCAYLVGPPSTFTQWASYLGSVPLLAVYDPEARISFSSFTVFPETT